MSDGRSYPERPLLGASVAVFRDGRVLIGRRNRPPLEGLWSLPGGLVELGETVEEAALRELAEETGVEAAIVGPAGHVDVISRDSGGRIERHFVVVALAARHRAGEGIAADGTSEVRWVEPRDLDGFTLTEGARDIIARAARLVAAADTPQQASR